MSSKELGLIHTVNKNFELSNIPGAPGTEQRVGFIDLPGELTSQLQRMVRAGNMFKVVGIDMTLDLGNVPNRDHIVSGYIRYFTPTRGRCAAFRGAFKAMAEQMKNQGITMRDNDLYDFRVPLTSTGTFPNCATLDGTNALALSNSVTPIASVFGVHNSGVRPTYTDTAGNLYSEGFSTLLSSAGTDFVLNDTTPYTGNHAEASESFETIPFQLKFSSDVANASGIATFQWRPDPALYLAVLCGQFEVMINTNDDSEPLATTPLTTLNVSVMVSGWKSIMGNPDKKKRSKKKRASRKGRK